VIAHRHLFCSLALVTGVGCASPMSQLRDDNHRLNQTVTDLRSDRREDERKMGDLEHQLDELRAKVVTATFDGSMPPQLPVEVASVPRGHVPPSQAPATTGSTNERVVGIADDGGEIVYEGDAATGKVAVPDSEDDQPAAPPPPRHAAPPPPGDDAVPDPQDPPHRDTAARAPVASHRARAHVDHEGGGGGATAAANDAASADYRAAVDLLKAGKQEDAITALRAFIAKYPHHDYADNAQYWLGEAYYAQKDYQRALVEFRATIETYPRGNKVPDALLKVGYCYAALGQPDRARAVLEQVVNLYPKSEPAALASKRLETNP
jgi:tol-pal system protein YbgF